MLNTHNISEWLQEALQSDSKGSCSTLNGETTKNIDVSEEVNKQGKIETPSSIMKRVKSSRGKTYWKSQRNVIEWDYIIKNE